MINTLILATFISTAIYMVAGFVAMAHDSILHRYAVSSSAPKPKAEKPKFVPVRPALKVQKSGAFNPQEMGIRQLRAHIRKFNLQDAVKAATGKSVSKCKLVELRSAFA